MGFFNTPQKGFHDDQILLCYSGNLVKNRDKRVEVYVWGWIYPGKLSYIQRVCYGYRVVEVGDFMPVLLQLAQNYTNPDSVNYKLA